jgi:hypothetical protein
MIQQFGPTMAPLIDVDIINNYQMNKVVELVSRSAFGSYKSTIPLHDDVRTRESPHDNLMGLFGDGATLASLGEVPNVVRRRSTSTTVDRNRTKTPRMNIDNEPSHAEKSEVKVELIFDHQRIVEDAPDHEWKVIDLTGPDLDGNGGRPSRDEVTPSSLGQQAHYILKIVNNAESAISSGMILLKCYKCTESVSCCRQCEHVVTERLETHSNNDLMSVKVVRCSAMKPSNCNVVMDANSDFGCRAHIGMLRNAAYLVGSGISCSRTGTLRPISQ